MTDILKAVGEYVLGLPPQSQAPKLMQLTIVFDSLRGISDGKMNQAIRAHEDLLKQPRTNSYQGLGGIALNMSKTNKEAGIVAEPCLGCGDGSTKTIVVLPKVATIEDSATDELAEKILDGDRNGVIAIARKSGVTNIPPDMPLAEIASKIQDKKKSNVYTTKS